LNLNVERNIRGANTTSFALDVPGGSLNGEKTDASPSPDPEVGLRYLMFVKYRLPGTPAPGGWHYPPVGGPQLFYFAGIDKSIDLPDEGMLSDEFELHCNYTGGN
jgi:hypothetical protein